MSDQATTTVRVKHRFTASPERLFDAWLDPEKARRFLFATPTGQMVRAETAPIITRSAKSAPWPSAAGDHWRRGSSGLTYARRTSSPWVGAAAASDSPP